MALNLIHARRLQYGGFTEETSAAYLKYDAHVEEIQGRAKKFLHV